MFFPFFVLFSPTITSPALTMARFNTKSSAFSMTDSNLEEMVSDKSCTASGSDTKEACGRNKGDLVAAGAKAIVEKGSKQAKRRTEEKRRMMVFCFALSGSRGRSFKTAVVDVGVGLTTMKMKLRNVVLCVVSSGEDLGI